MNEAPPYVRSRTEAVGSDAILARLDHLEGDVADRDNRDLDTNDREYKELLERQRGNLAEVQQLRTKLRQLLRDSEGAA